MEQFHERNTRTLCTEETGRLVNPTGARKVRELGSSDIFSDISEK